MSHGTRGWHKSHGTTYGNIGLQWGSGKSEGALNTRRKERCWRAVTQRRETCNGNTREGWLGQLVKRIFWEAEAPF